MTDSKRSARDYVFKVMGVIVLASLCLLGIFAFPVGFSLCGIIGFVYGIVNRDKAFIKWSLLAILVGAAMVTYTLLLIDSM